MSGLTRCVRGRFCWKRIKRRTSRVRGLRWRTPTIWLAGRAVPGADPDDARELLNYRDAFELISTYLIDGRAAARSGAITERLILEIHRRLVAGVRGGSAGPGEYRRLQNYVINAATGGDMS